MIYFMSLLVQSSKNKNNNGVHMNKNEKIIKHFSGRIVCGGFSKIDGSFRKFWGVLKYEDRDTPNLITVYDFRIKGYRRFRLDQGSILLKSGDRYYQHSNIKGVALKSRSS